MSLSLLYVTLRGVSNKHCLLSLFSFVSDLVGNPKDWFSHNKAQMFISGTPQNGTNPIANSEGPDQTDPLGAV